MYLEPSTPIRIIARFKHSMLGDHWGVQLSDGSVVHLTPERGVERVSLAEVCAGKRPGVVRLADARRDQQTLWRVYQALRQPVAYHATENNCETFALWLIGEKAESPQVLRVTLIGLIALGIAALQ